VDEGLIILGGLFAAVWFIGLPIVLIVALVRMRRLDALARRVEQLERQIHGLGSRPAPLPPEQPPPVVAEPIASEPAPTPIEVQPAISAPLVPSAPSEGASLEDLIGRKALGWVAVIVLLFATGFFIRYAFENQWVGPLGRVTIGVLAGLALVADGWRRHRMGWRNFAQMLTAGGIVLLYLATFGAFGFYHLLPQREAGIFLFLLVVESALLALRYESPAIALMAVIGGLLTPVLMHADRDQYVSLFVYLGVLNAGFIGLLLRRAWPAVGTVALVGTQLLFWAWYDGNYHPEKLAWALGFQAVIFGLYLFHEVAIRFLRPQPATWEDVVRLPLGAAFWTAAGYVLLNDNYHPWLGSLAVAMAAIYALVARVLLSGRNGDNRVLVAAIGIAAAYLALAFPLQADAQWVALGWAALAGTLWWFGVRLKAMPLRIMAGVGAILSVGRILFVDTPQSTRPLFTPIFNAYALPALAATACLALALVATRKRLGQLSPGERTTVGGAAISCVLLVWLVVSIDLWNYFDALALVSPDEHDWQRFAQMSLSAWWSVYAAIVLTLGFRAGQAWMRWTALGLFALTVLKVFLFDMAGLDQIYRIVAFFVLAILLGVATWAYQRRQPDRMPAEIN
jgi:uncharacterized membrane protein